jgi:hypothetical protein
MSYAYPTVQKGEVLVGFSTARSWNPLSALIRWVTGSSCSHAWLLYDDEDLRMLMVMESHITFQLVPYEAWLKSNRVVALYHPGHDLNPGLRELALRLGSYYDVGGLLGVLPVKLGRWLKATFRGLRLRVRNPWNSSGALFCSEAVAFALQASDFPGAQRLERTSVSPQELCEFLFERNVRVEAP